VRARGTVGVKDLFGSVSPTSCSAGRAALVVPFTRVHRCRCRTQEVKETAEVPSKEGLTMDSRARPLPLDPTKAAEVYKTVGPNYPEILVRRRSARAIREITASYEAKALYSRRREQISPRDVRALPEDDAGDAASSSEAGPAAQDRPAAAPSPARSRRSSKREQEAEQMKFVLAEGTAGGRAASASRRQGIADFQQIVARRDLLAAARVEGHRGDREARDEPERQGRRRRESERAA
jgi:hypothetical protein